MIATSRNRVESNNDATFHAEIDCIRLASSYLKNWRLSDCTLYSTLEPCPMCMGAIQAARIKRLVYAAKDKRLGACGSFINLIEERGIGKHPFHSIEVTGGILEDQASLLLRRFFQVARRRDIFGDEDL